jgi:hypothetical protein
MPAVTVDPARAFRHDRAARLRGRGLPGPPRLRRRRPALTSTPSSTWTRWARWSTRPVSRRARRGTPPWFRDRHLHARRHLAAPGLQRRGGLITDGDTQWMTAGSGILHIEAPPEEVVHARGALPRVPAVGEPARGAEVDRAALPGPARHARSRWLTSHDGGALLRVIAGEVAGQSPDPGRPTRRSR